MADVKISALPAATQANLGDIFPKVDSVSGVTQKITLTQIIALITGTQSQLLIYTTTDPTTDGIVPANQNAPAKAYKFDGSGADYSWRTDTHEWV